jgi:hypothetical protein
MTGRTGISLASMLAVVVVLAAAGAQSGQPSSSAAKDGSQVPDLSGVWVLEGHQGQFGRINALLLKGEPPFQPSTEKQYRETQKDVDRKEDPDSNCLLPGVPRIWISRYPFEIVHARGEVLILHEYRNAVRRIFLDGRGHPSDLVPSYMGHSVGKWEGDTLVVDSTGFTDDTWLDHLGLPHSDALHVVERIRRVKRDALEVEITIDDPKAYSKPWSSLRRFELQPTWRVMEEVCTPYVRGEVEEP